MKIKQIQQYRQLLQYRVFLDLEADLCLALKVDRIDTEMFLHTCLYILMNTTTLWRNAHLSVVHTAWGTRIYLDDEYVATFYPDGCPTTYIEANIFINEYQMISINFDQQAS